MRRVRFRDRKTRRAQRPRKNCLNHFITLQDTQDRPAQCATSQCSVPLTTSHWLVASAQERPLEGAVYLAKPLLIVHWNDFLIRCSKNSTGLCGKEGRWRTNVKRNLKNTEKRNVKRTDGVTCVLSPDMSPRLDHETHSKMSSRFEHAPRRG